MNKKTLRVGMFGFGRTGRAVATVLFNTPHVELEWVARRSVGGRHRSVAEVLGVDSDTPAPFHATDAQDADTLLDQHPVDAIVDFSGEDGVLYYGEAAARRGITIISAISDYSPERLELLRELAERTVVMHSPNITVGINFLLMAAKVLRRILPDIDVEVFEEHFRSKPEVSGTAKVIAGELGIEEERIRTVRAGGIIGVHEVLFGFPYQTVRLKHESIAREAFGNGILFALDNLRDKTAGFYTMEDLMRPYFQLDCALPKDAAGAPPADAG